MERDDIVEYSLDVRHSEEAGKKIRKKIWKVTIILTLITIVEVILGSQIKQTSDYWPIIKWSFIVLTLIKAAYIVLSFMHLGDERKAMKYVILIPYVVFIIYLIFVLLWEASEIGGIWAIYSS